MALKTDYQDQVLNTSVNTQRKYEMITNDDNTISLTDVSTYTQEGDDFTAEIINTTNETVNTLSEKIYIEETGTSNSWTYRKWSDGTMEAWRAYSDAGKAGTSINWPASGYRFTTSVTLPTGFIENPVVLVSGYRGSGYSWTDIVNVSQSTSVTIAWYSNQNNVSGVARLYAIGKWQ